MFEEEVHQRVVEEIDRLAGIRGDQEWPSGLPDRGRSLKPEDDAAIRAATTLAGLDWSGESRRRAEVRARWIDRTRDSRRASSFSQKVGVLLTWSGRVALAGLVLAFLGLSWRMIDQAAHGEWDFGIRPASPTASALPATSPARSASRQPTAAPLPGVLPVPQATSSLVTSELPMAASARLGKGQVMALAVSGDGLQIAVGSSIGVCVYSAKTFSETWCAESPGPILQLAFNPAGDRLLARTRDGILSEWEVAGGRQTPRISPGVNGVRSFTWAPDGQRIAVAGEAGDLALIDAQTLASTPITEDQVNLPVILAWAPDGKRIALANIQGAVGIYDLASNKTTLLPQPTAYGNPYPTTRLAWSPDSGMLILGSGTQAAAPGQASGEIRFWDTRSGAFVRQISIQNPVINLQLSPDGSRLAALQAGGTVALWDPQGGQQLDLTSGFQVGNPALAWTGDGQRLLLVDSSGQVATWGIAASSVSRAIDGYTSPVVDLAWSPDGKTIAASYLSGQLVLWDASTHHEARAWKGDPTQALRLAWDPQPGVQLLAVGGENVVLWNMATGNPVRQIASDLPRVGVLAWSSKGWQVAAGGVTGIVYVWEANTGQILQRIDVGHEVVGVGWSPDEQTLAAAWSEGGTGGIELYDGASGKHLASLNSGANIGELAWSRDGTKLAALAGGWVSVWDADTHHLLFNLGAGHSTGVESFAWAPDSQRMATAGGEIFVWDVGARQKVKTFEGYTGDVVALSFSPDGKDLASGSSDGTVLVWNLTR